MSGEVLEETRNAEFRLSSRQRDMLRTLNMLFEELSPAPIAEEDLLDLCESQTPVVHVSRIVRD
jgi:hypothetical protein